MKLTLMIVLLVLLVAMIGAGIWLYDPDRSRAALEAKYHVAPTDYVEAAGVRLHVLATGPKDRPAVILLHGFGSSLFTWEPWARMLEKDYRVVRFDLPGFGLTGVDPTGTYTDARSLEVLAALMDRLGLPKASLVGNSMGGRIAWMFAATHPERVTKLVLISPDGFASPGVPYGTRTKLPAMARLMRYTLPTPLIRMSLAPAYADPKLITDEAVARYRDLMLAPGVRGAILARMDQSVLEDPLPLLARITAPTLLVWGEKDGMIPFSNATDYLQAIPNVTLVSFPDLGHVPFEEAPARSLEPVAAFLAR